MIEYFAIYILMIYFFAIDIVILSMIISSKNNSS